MSLIPSESYSFPDHFTRTVVPSRKPKEAEPEPVPLETGRRTPAIVPLADPEAPPAPVLQREKVDASRNNAPVAVPNPALRRANAPPPRIPEAPLRKVPPPPSLKPKVRSNTRAPAMDSAPTLDNGAPPVPAVAPPAQNVIPMKPARAPRPAPPPETLAPENPVSVPTPKPISVARTAPPAQARTAPELPRTAATSNRQADFFEMFAQTGETAVSKRRRKKRMRRFIVCEAANLAVLLPLVVLGLARRPENVALVWTMNILTIASAVGAGLIPILFFAVAPKLPETEG